MISDFLIYTLVFATFQDIFHSMGRWCQIILQFWISHICNFIEIGIFLIGIHSMQGWTVTKRHGCTGKRSIKSLKHTENLFRKNLKMSVNSRVNITKIISQRKAFYRKRILESSCVRKGTVDIDILVASRNSDRKIMQSIRIMRPLYAFNSAFVVSVAILSRIPHQSCVLLQPFYISYLCYDCLRNIWCKYISFVVFTQIVCFINPPGIFWVSVGLPTALT